MRLSRLALLATTTMLCALPVAGRAQLVTMQPDPAAEMRRFVVDPTTGPAMPRDTLIQRLRDRVKYVFVIFNENHSFDNEFGTFPGANGLFADQHGARDAAHTPGFSQSYTDANGAQVTVSPFRIGPEQNATFVDSVDHSHTGLAKKLNVGADNVARMDRFAAAEYDRFASRGGAANQAMGAQYARLVMSYIDCDTIPFMWAWASRFTLFDNIFATEDTPSSPNAVAMLAGQAGETQWVKHGADSPDVSGNGQTGKLQGVPMFNDPQPFYGSQFDTGLYDREPRGSWLEGYANTNVSRVLTFASLPLTFQGHDVTAAMRRDRAPAIDLPDVQQDIPFIQSRGGAPVNWRWYEEGYDHEPNDAPDQASHFGYVSHHNGAQYFGYIANNPALQANLRGLGDFFADMKQNRLLQGGGVFYVRGGFLNIAGQNPPIQNANFPAALTAADRAAINLTKRGDDDHPGYSDRQISETMAAAVINSVAGNPDLWRQSMIVITYDESDGFYDHVPPRILSYGPDQLPLARGIRVPMLVISPYARAHVVSHAEGDHNAVIETINAIFDLPALASLPDEKAALLAGEDPKFNGPNGFVQHNLGPRDLNTPATDDLLSAFEPGRLDGSLPPLPATYAMVSDEALRLPHFNGRGCAAIGMTPEDRRQKIETAVPAGFNTLPSTLPQYNMPR